MELIEKYFTNLSSQQKLRFEALDGLYREWNDKINVISRQDIQNLYLHHILHSLSIAKYISFTKGTKILDIGTGGGFPGIPLAIMFPGSTFVLIDSIGKKIKVVEQIINSLELKNCSAKKIRADEIKEKFDFVVNRAVAPISEMIPWVRNSFVKKSIQENEKGILCLKGGDLTKELIIPQKTNVIEISSYFSELFFIEKKIVHIFM